jgi:acetyl-CoA acetyltransferase
MPNTTDIAIVSAVRTPMGRYCGKLKDFTAMELGAIAGKRAIEHAAEAADLGECAAVEGSTRELFDPVRRACRGVDINAGVAV